MNYMTLIGPQALYRAIFFKPELGLRQRECCPISSDDSLRGWAAEMDPFFLGDSSTSGEDPGEISTRILGAWSTKFFEV